MKKDVLDTPFTIRNYSDQAIQGSLAIEGNALSTEQITAILNGKPVIAPPKEVQEVRNALKAYEKIHN